jgi:hypothetical protein
MVQAPEAPSPASAPDPKLILVQTALAIVKRSEEQNIPIDFDNLDPFNDLLDGFFVDDVKAALQRLERSGDVYEVRPGFWKLVRPDNFDE